MKPQERLIGFQSQDRRVRN